MSLNNLSPRDLHFPPRRLGFFACCLGLLDLVFCLGDFRPPFGDFLGLCFFLLGLLPSLGLLPRLCGKYTQVYSNHIRVTRARECTEIQSCRTPSACTDRAHRKDVDLPLTLSSSCRVRSSADGLPDGGESRRLTSSIRRTVCASSTAFSCARPSRAAFALLRASVEGTPALRLHPCATAHGP